MKVSGYFRKEKDDLLGKLQDKANCLESQCLPTLYNMNARVMTVAKEKGKNEKKEVKPSTELVPDEYNVLFDGKECVHIFVADSNLVQEYVNFLKASNIGVPASNIHMMESDEEIEKILKEVANSPNETSVLLMLFWGYSLQDGKYILEDESTLPYYKIWTPFLSGSSEKFRDIPKVFLLNVIKSKKIQETDALLYKPAITSPYSVPNEADLLIIYKHNDDSRESIAFIMELAEILGEHGKKEDLCSIVSIIDTSYFTRPVIISTLLKKFYMIPSQSRGHLLNFEMNHELVLTELMVIEELLTKVEKEKPQGSPSIIKKMKKKFSSFRSKSIQNRDSMKEEITDKSQPTVNNPTTETVPRKLSRDISARTSVERPVPRVSLGRTQAKKISREEKKPWIP